MSRLGLMGAGPEAGGGAFTPASLPNLVGWWDFSTLGLSDGAAIASVPDLSGNGNTLTAAGSKQPTFKTAQINGLGVGRFDNVDDGMVSPLVVSAVPLTLIGVWKATSGVATTRRAVQGSTNFLMGPYNDQHRFFNGGFVPTTPANDGAAHVHSFAITTGSGIGFIDGVSQGDSGFGGLPGTIGLGAFTGANAPGELFIGDFGALIACAALLNTTQRQNGEGFLKVQWGTP